MPVLNGNLRAFNSCAESLKWNKSNFIALARMCVSSFPENWQCSTIFTLLLDKITVCPHPLPLSYCWLRRTDERKGICGLPWLCFSFYAITFSISSWLTQGHTARKTGFLGPSCFSKCRLWVWVFEASSGWNGMVGDMHTAWPPLPCGLIWCHSQNTSSRTTLLRISRWQQRALNQEHERELS